MGASDSSRTVQLEAAPRPAHFFLTARLPDSELGGASCGAFVVENEASQLCGELVGALFCGERSATAGR